LIYQNQVDSSLREASIVQQVIPALRITDYTVSKAFYVDKLHFQIEWEHRFEPHFPVFMEISRDGITIDLTEHTGDCQVGGLIHIYVPDVDAWCAELRASGVPVDEPNERIPRLRMMTVTDPDGNQLRICTRLNE
jgi:catechol 2,3-dioxygenase-like lactoylglutathione lyase family enzyme